MSSISRFGGEPRSTTGDELTRFLIEEAREKSRQATAMGVDERVLATGALPDRRHPQV